MGGSRFPDSEPLREYDIRSRDLVCYLLFGIIIAPFQAWVRLFVRLPALSWLERAKFAMWHPPLPAVSVHVL